MSDREIEKQLTSISGIGTWTAQMLLIFYLHRPDILPLNDVGSIEAVALHYNSGNRLSVTEIVKISQIWQPYRTVATWYLWRSLDSIAIQC